MKINDAPRAGGAMRLILALVAPLSIGAAPTKPRYDVVIRGGMIYDGSGGAGFVGDVAIVAGRILAVGRVDKQEASAAA
jgi:N-acyl-D-amino-acid deacylase